MWMEVGGDWLLMRYINFPIIASPIRVCLGYYVDFYRIEKKILEGLGFDVLGEGVGDRQVKAVLLMIREILDMDFYHVLCKVT